MVNTQSVAPFNSEIMTNLITLGQKAAIEYRNAKNGKQDESFEKFYKIYIEAIEFRIDLDLLVISEKNRLDIEKILKKLVKSDKDRPHVKERINKHEKSVALKKKRNHINAQRRRRSRHLYNRKQMRIVR